VTKGKLDGRSQALVDLEINARVVSRMNEQSQTERKVAEVYARILELKWVTREDDIFSLGGDSVQAVRIALELERLFDIQLPIELLESDGRVRDIAAWIDAERNTHGT
jgi:acyl carrier protein